MRSDDEHVDVANERSEQFHQDVDLYVKLFAVLEWSWNDDNLLNW